MRWLRTIEIRGEAGAIFELSQDYRRRLDWDPFLRRAELLGGAVEAGMGVTARCQARTGFAMETRYVSFRPPVACAVEMTRGPWIFRSFAGSWRFEAVEPGLTRVSFAYNLIARPAALTPLLGQVFAGETTKRLAALKRTIESATPEGNAAGSSLAGVS